jgi:hypothetical protein
MLPLMHHDINRREVAASGHGPDQPDRSDDVRLYHGNGAERKAQEQVAPADAVGEPGADAVAEDLGEWRIRGVPA